jgi:hypothetical protein
VINKSLLTLHDVLQQFPELEKEERKLRKKE